jgi:DNA-binding transcriptional MerR regulator
MEIQGESSDWSIGRLAEASGLPVKTVRFYSDAGLLLPRRTAAGHRRYAPSDLARVELIRSLRALDVDLSTIADLLKDATSLQDVLHGHARTLEVHLRALQRQLAVARAAAEATDERTLSRLHALLRIEAAERDQLLDRFWEDVLVDAFDDDAAWFRAAGRPELPDAPTAAQIDAWIELSELASDSDFRQAIVTNAGWFSAQTHPGFNPATYHERLTRALQLAGEAEAADIDPGDPRAAPAVQAYVAAHADAFGRPPSPAFRRWLSKAAQQPRRPAR